MMILKLILGLLIFTVVAVVACLALFTGFIINYGDVLILILVLAMIMKFLLKKSHG